MFTQEVINADTFWMDNFPGSDYKMETNPTPILHISRTYLIGNQLSESSRTTNWAGLTIPIWSFGLSDRFCYSIPSWLRTHVQTSHTCRQPCGSDLFGPFMHVYLHVLGPSYFFPRPLLSSFTEEGRAIRIHLYPRSLVIVHISPRYSPSCDVGLPSAFRSRPGTSGR